MASGERKKIGKYDVIDVIGRGGMGVVYKAVDPGIGRTVAIKMTTAAVVADPELLMRFKREAQSVGNLQHPNIVTVYDLGVEDGGPYLVMELLDGESLDSIVRSRRPISLEEKLDIVVQVCNGIQYAHQRKVIHRDIKPGNVMILKDGTAKIVDFGIAQMGLQRLTRPGQLVGSFQYMSPEQINGANVDSRTDIFSIGVMLFELVAGRLPFEGKDTGDMLMKILHDPTPALSGLVKNCPAGLDEIVQRALAKDPDQRYQTADELSLDLGHVLEKWRRERISEYLQAAETAATQRQWARAKEQLLQVLKRDRQNSRANVRLREVQAEIQKQQRSERAKELQAQAEHALAQSDVATALTYLNEAVELDRDNQEIVQLRDSLQESRGRTEKLRDLMQRAELAQEVGELEEAQKLVEEGLALDPSNPDFRSMQVVITREIAGRDKKKRVQEFLGEARQQVSSRRFTGALEVLRKAEALDPSASAIQELIVLATTGQQQEKRRQDLERLTAQIEEALVKEDYATASARIDEGLRSYPDDRGLLKLRAVLNKQGTDKEKSRYIEEQTAQAKVLLDAGRAADALALLQKAVEKYPAEPTLEAMLTLVQQSIERTRKEQEKAEVIQSAREAIRRKAYPIAISILEAARKKTTSNEYDELLQFAQNEAENQAKDAVAEEARRLTAEDKYADAIALLKATLQEIPDQELEIILADAQRHVDEFTAATETVIAKAERLQSQDRFADAVKLLEGQNTQFGKDPKFRAALENARERLCTVQIVSQLKREVRDALEAGDFARARQLCQDSRKTRDVPDIGLLEEEIQNKHAAAVNAQVETALRDARLLVTVESSAAALSVLETVQKAVPFAAPELRKRYEMLQAAARSAMASQTQPPQAPGTPPPSAAAPPDSENEQETRLADPARLESMLVEVSGIAGNYRDDKKVQSAIYEVKQQLTKMLRESSSDYRKQPGVAGPQIPSQGVRGAELVGRLGGGLRGFLRGRTGIIVGAGILAVVIAAIGLRFTDKNPPPPPPPVPNVAVRIHTSPPGATIKVNNEVRGVSDLQLDLPLGSNEIEADLNGYVPAKMSLEAKSDSANSINLTLQPALPTLRLSSDTGEGKVTLDDAPAMDLAGEERRIESIAAGDHKVRFAGPQGSASFSFSVSPGVPPVVAGPITASGVMAVVVAGLGAKVRVYSSKPTVKASLDDQPPQELSPQGLHLENVPLGKHQLLIKDGSDQYQLAIEAGPAPSLSTFLQSGKNIGTLVVMTGQDGVKVFVNGVAQKNPTKAGQLSIAGLEPKEYTISVSKPEFQAVAPQKVVVRKGENKLLFVLTPILRVASLSIRGGPPGAQVLIDDKPVGALLPDGSLLLPSINPGQHTIVFRKDRFEPRRVVKNFVAGQETVITGPDVAMQQSTGVLRITFSPPEAVVTLAKAGEGPIKATSGQSLVLAPGSYTIVARMGEISTTKTVEVVAGQTTGIDLPFAPNGMSKWDDPSSWKPEQNAYVHRGGGFVLYGVSPTSGAFSFSVELQKGKRLQWFLNYTSPRDYVLFQMDENNFYRSVFRNDQESEQAKIPHKIQKKAFQTMRIRVTPSEIVHEIKDGDTWFTLDRFASPGPDLSVGRFGFNLPGKDQVAIMNFNHYPSLDSR